MEIKKELKVGMVVKLKDGKKVKITYLERDPGMRDTRVTVVSPDGRESQHSSVSIFTKID